MSRYQNAEQNRDLVINSKLLENVAKFKYLGGSVTNQIFCEIWGFHGAGDEGCKVVRNVGSLPQHYTAPQSRRPGLESKLHSWRI